MRLPDPLTLDGVQQDTCWGSQQPVTHECRSCGVQWRAVLTSNNVVFNIDQRSRCWMCGRRGEAYYGGEAVVLGMSRTFGAH